MGILMRRLALILALLLVAVVHAIGAMRFHELGLVLLSILPLFALLPAWLIPVKSSHGNS